MMIILWKILKIGKFLKYFLQATEWGTVDTQVVMNIFPVYVYAFSKHNFAVQ